METTELLFALLRHAVCGEELREDIRQACTPDNLETVYKLAKKHDVAHLVAIAIEQLQIPVCEVMDKLRKTKITAIYRYAKLDNELGKVCDVLEEEKIPFIPLKGSVLRRYYPEPWMRTSADIDILVDESNLKKASICLTEKLGYICKGRAYHDVSFVSSSGILLELHFILTEESKFPKAQEFLYAVWEHTEAEQGKHYEKQMQGSMFLFYHILHMANHVQGGGCGIRFFLDYHIINQRVPYDREKYHKLLSQSGLQQFADLVDALSMVWFEREEYCRQTKMFEQFIISGGTFGSINSRVAIKTAIEGGKRQWLWTQFFLPYDQLKGLYPILQKQKWLTPVFQLVRWFRLLSPERLRRSIRLLKSSMQTSHKEADQSGLLMRELGLYLESEEDK